MRADATHRFEFEVDGGRRPGFVCLARTRQEASSIARRAGAPVRLVDQVPLGADEGDGEARREVRKVGLLREPWADDVVQIVTVLDHVRWTGDGLSLVPVAFLPLTELRARGLQECGCGRPHRDAEARGLRAVEPHASVFAAMIEDGGWQLHLWLRDSGGAAERLEQEGWSRCDGEHCSPAFVLDLRPGCSVWTVAHMAVFALMVAADLRPGELSCVPVGVDGLKHR